ncbi:glycerol acyltransferase [Flavobacterium salmonis]|uniref:Glycerol acyltransferase n=2 Tax=Flavobacterium salmonis TaxID=2654844 RepID=A0A6V6YWY9_9FLAO|nr:glycerol acyltransferase [Flavobacterium salmonis]
MNLYELIIKKIGFNNFFIKIILQPICLLLKMNRFESLLDEAKTYKNIKFIDFVFYKFNIKNQAVFLNDDIFLSNKPFIIVANHPTGLLDGLSIIHVLLKRNKKVKIVVNYLLKEFAQIHEALGENFIYVNPFDHSKKKHLSYLGLKEIIKSLSNNEVVVFFPAGDISKIKGRKFNIADNEWNDTCIKFINKSKITVVPVFIDSKNSSVFYLLNTLSNKIGLLFIFREFFNKCNTNVRLVFGNEFENQMFENHQEMKKKLKDSVYQLKKDSYA